MFYLHNLNILKKQIFKNYAMLQQLHLTDQDFQEMRQLVETNYYKELSKKQNQIKDFTLSLYGFTPEWCERKTSDIMEKIINFMRDTETNIDSIKKEIQKYLGYNAAFYTFKEGKRMPVHLQRIDRALQLIDGKASIIQIENALYF